MARILKSTVSTVCKISDESGQLLERKNIVFEGRIRVRLRITSQLFFSGGGAPYYQQGAVYPPADPYQQVKSSSPLLFLSETRQTSFLNMQIYVPTLVRMAYIVDAF